MKLDLKKYLKPTIILHWVILAWVALTAMAFLNLLQAVPSQFPTAMAIVVLAIIIGICDIGLEETLGI